MAIIALADLAQDPLRLVAKMSQYPHDPHTPRPKEAMALVLLFTPMFAHSLIENRDSAPTVLTSAIAHIFEPMLIAPGDPQRFLALAAVVDRLPGHGNGPIKDKQGYEGIGYAVMPESLISSTDRTISSKSLPKDAPETGTLTFEVQAMIKNPFFVDTNDGIAHRIEMPLANTIFQTGRNTTMLACQYISAARENTGQAGSREARRNLLFTNRLDLLHQKVTWPLKYWLEHDEVEHYGTQSMHIPLVPLTIPREVRSGMGNIIRETVSAEGKPVPASQELERAVSAYFRAERLVPHAMPVWALVSSRDAAEEMSCRIMERIKLLHRLPLEQTTPTEVQAFISQHFMDVWDTPLRGWTTIMWNAMFKGGARLHRVLSGGGGWGKKAGLLSLDPRVSVVQASEDQPPSFEFDERFDGGRSSLTQPLEEVAKEGEFIQFFAAFKPFRWSDWTPMTPDKTKRMLVLGAIPSSIDDIRHREPDDASLTNIRHHIKFFGVLSEKGMSIHSVLRNGGPSGDKECLRSMVDVPFAMFRQRLPADHLVSGHREIVPEIEPDDFDSSKEPEPEEREEVEAQTDSNKSETGSSKVSLD
ncbi:uncharacterized protein K452DRAFT_309737 [Aplosporella prunicola CBS 121167]|uniref:Uncharacterized protein n=1 Tax=Aplosporella prunicola CBS 121167 TaxID=1176127 RepID=A0A6A6BDQ9_9PEZI|nr:uncharacterized protein K452DRAFT_309737 [Aplosporella prunicola CBS 121167]KAF2140611.1 hypothetical protein K452DRAFT_309737 [Aplosporella prunicola CBS 121167]